MTSSWFGGVAQHVALLWCSICGICESWHLIYNSRTRLPRIAILMPDMLCSEVIRVSQVT
jgi:hypothetical protein